MKAAFSSSTTAVKQDATPDAAKVFGSEVKQSSCMSLIDWMLYSLVSFSNAWTYFSRLSDYNLPVQFVHRNIPISFSLIMVQKRKLDWHVFSPLSPASNNNIQLTQNFRFHTKLIIIISLRRCMKS